MRRPNILLAITSLALMQILSSPIAYAHCPLCTAAVGAGVVVARFYGVDDTIVGAWIGAFIVSSALWFSRVVKKRYKWHFPLLDFWLTGLALVFTLVPFYFAGLIGNPHYVLFGVDKLLLGILAGSIVAYSAVFASSKLKERRGKVFFPFQTIVATVLFLLLASFAFWRIAR